MSIVINKTYIPQKRNLINVVKRFSYYKYSKNICNSVDIGIFPNANANIELILDGTLQTEQSHPVKIEAPTIATMPIKLKQSKKLEMIVIQFTTYSLYHLLRTPINQLLNTSLSLDYIFNPIELTYLKDTLRQEEVPIKKMILLEDFLSQKINIKNIIPTVIQAQKLINLSPSISVDDLSELLYISPRGLRKVFQKHFGISPKFYSRIKRFNASINSMDSNPHKSLTSIALDSGYYDQAHFIREFKMFTAISPKNYANKTTLSNYFDLTIKV